MCVSTSVFRQCSENFRSHLKGILNKFCWEYKRRCFIVLVYISQSNTTFFSYNKFVISFEFYDQSPKNIAYSSLSGSVLKHQAKSLKDAASAPEPVAPPGMAGWLWARNGPSRSISPSNLQHTSKTSMKHVSRSW